MSCSCEYVSHAAVDEGQQVICILCPALSIAGTQLHIAARSGTVGAKEEPVTIIPYISILKYPW